MALQLLIDINIDIDIDVLGPRASMVRGKHSNCGGELKPVKRELKTKTRETETHGKRKMETENGKREAENGNGKWEMQTEKRTHVSSSQDRNVV